MPVTRLSLLDRLASRDQSTWSDFDDTYRPLLHRWLHGNGLSDADVEDLIQEVMLFVPSNLDRFDHNTWMPAVTV